MTFPKTRSIPRECHDILQDRPTGHMATVRPDGRLSVTPVSPMFDGEYVRVSTVKTRQQYKNLVADPRIAISIPHRNHPNRYVEIPGHAEPATCTTPTRVRGQRARVATATIAISPATSAKRWSRNVSGGA